MHGQFLNLDWDVIARPCVKWPLRGACGQLIQYRPVLAAMCQWAVSCLQLLMAVCTAVDAEGIHQCTKSLPLRLNRKISRT